MTKRLAIFIFTAASLIGMLTLGPARAAAQAQSSAAAAKAKWARDLMACGLPSALRAP